MKKAITHELSSMNGELKKRLQQNLR